MNGVIRLREIRIEAEPQSLTIDLEKTALLLIDMQRDFLEEGGFGESLGNDVSLLKSAVEPCRRMLQRARKLNLPVIHTREGHLSDLSDAPASKLERGDPSIRIGAMGPMGRILIRGEPGQGLIDSLKPKEDELVIDKPGKGAFYATGLQEHLKHRGIENLLVGGVTTEVCVHTTVREANDRGYRCIVLSDCCASYFPEFHRVALEMVSAQGGIFGWVSDSQKVLSALDVPQL